MTEYIKIPMDILLGNSGDNNNYAPFKKINVRNKFNFIDEFGNLISNIWFTKIEEDCFTNGNIIVATNGSLYNILNVNKSFAFNTWYHCITRLDYKDTYERITYKVYEKKRGFKLYVDGIGFISNKIYNGCYSTIKSMYVFYDDNHTLDLYNAETNELYENVPYDVIKSCNNLMIVIKNNKFNLIDEKNNLLFENWVSETPKHDCEYLTVFGDKINGYYIINKNNKIVNKEKFNNVICDDYCNNNELFSFFNDKFIVARKDDVFFCLDKDGEIICEKNISMNSVKVGRLFDDFIVKKILNGML